MTQTLLGGLRVLEWGEFVSVPHCTRILATMGADVIKLERPEGDAARRYGPFPGDVPHQEKSGLFLALNAGKRGVTVNPATAAGRNLLLRLVKDTDVLVEDHLPAHLSAVGLSYEDLHTANTRLIVVSVTPFGQDGPRRDHQASNLILGHVGSYAYYYLPPVDDIEEEPPLSPGAHQMEFVVGVAGAFATLTAVLRRDQTGEGAHLDLSGLEAIGQLLSSNVTSHLVGDVVTTRHISAMPKVGTATEVIPCMDGYVCLSLEEQPFWERLLEVIGKPAWGNDPDFRNGVLRRQHRREIRDLLSEWTMRYGKEALSKRLQAERIPCYPIGTPGDLLESDQMAHRGFFQELEHPVAGKLPYMTAPYRMSATPVRLERPAPLLGQHNEEVYCGQLGYSQDDLLFLRRTGSI